MEACSKQLGSPPWHRKTPDDIWDPKFQSRGPQYIAYHLIQCSSTIWVIRTPLTRSHVQEVLMWICMKTIPYRCVDFQQCAFDVLASIFGQTHCKTSMVMQLCSCALFSMDTVCLCLAPLHQAMMFLRATCHHLHPCLQCCCRWLRKYMCVKVANPTARLYVACILEWPKLHTNEHGGGPKYSKAMLATWHSQVDPRKKIKAFL